MNETLLFVAVNDKGEVIQPLRASTDLATFASDPVGVNVAVYQRTDEMHGRITFGEP